MLESTGKISGILNVGDFCLFELANGLTVIGFPIVSNTPGQSRDAYVKLERAVENLKSGGGKYVIVTEDRWWMARGLVEERLLAHVGNFHQVYARNCTVRRITKPEASAFLSKFHSYGSASGRHFYGLFINRMGRELRGLSKGDLVAVSEFSNARTLKKSEGDIKSYEWVRHCSMPNLRISGGMGKILEYFIGDIHPGDVMSYSDNEWSDGAVYRQLGFEKESQRPPVDFAIDPDTWQRIPLSRLSTPKDNYLYYKNLGSTKWRLRL